MNLFYRDKYSYNFSSKNSQLQNANHIKQIAKWHKYINANIVYYNIHIELYN